MPAWVWRDVRSVFFFFFTPSPVSVVSPADCEGVLSASSAAPPRAPQPTPMLRALAAAVVTSWRGDGVILPSAIPRRHLDCVLYDSCDACRRSHAHYTLRHYADKKGLFNPLFDPIYRPWMLCLI